MRLKSCASECPITGFLNKGAETAARRQSEAIASGSHQTDSATKEGEIDNQIPENHAPVRRREQVDDVLGTCDTIRQSAENEGQQNEKR